MRIAEMKDELGYTCGQIGQQLGVDRRTVHLVINRQGRRKARVSRSVIARVRGYLVSRYYRMVAIALRAEGAGRSVRSVRSVGEQC